MQITDKQLKHEVAQAIWDVDPNLIGEYKLFTDMAKAAIETMKKKYSNATAK